MWVELCSNRFFNLDEASLIYAEINKDYKYDIKIVPKKIYDDKKRILSWQKNFNSEDAALIYIRKYLYQHHN